MNFIEEIDPVFSSRYRGKRWPWSSVQNKCGIYAITYEDFVYVGLTQARFPFRWRDHVKTLFYGGKKNTDHKKFKSLIEEKEISLGQLTFHILESYDYTAGVSDELDLVLAERELEIFRKIEGKGFTMLNNEPPRGTRRKFVHDKWKLIQKD